MNQPAGTKSSTHSISYEFKKITGQILNYRQLASKPAGVGYLTILIRDSTGAERVLHNVHVPHSIDPYLHSAKRQITIAFVQGQGDGKNDKPFGCVAAVVAADGQMHSDIGSLYTFSRGIRAQARLPYYDLCKGGVAACLVFFIGLPIVVYSLLRLYKLKTPVLTEEFSRQEFKKLGFVGM